MRVIFLDIDGVMNNPGCYAGGHSGARALYLPSAVAALNHITDSTGAHIVISSSWRLGTPLPDLRSILHAWGVTGKVLDATPFHSMQSRGVEIQAWLDAVRDWRDVDAFVILDDDCGGMEPLIEHFVQVRGHVGLTMDDARLAVLMLAGVVA